MQAHLATTSKGVVEVAVFAVVAQSVHDCAPDVATYFPVPQSAQTDAPPAARENFPATQTWHAPSAVAPLLGRYLPPPHA
jgi:hypothetical protein